MDPSPPEVFHDGEKAIQTRLGVHERVAQIGRVVIRDHMPDQHREFFAQLPFVIAAAVDATGQPWASLLAGPPGFMASPDPRQLLIGAAPEADDPLHGALAAGGAIGLLGIEPHTRRRNRMNGLIERLEPAQISVRVSQSFGNCPKYIQARQAQWVEPSPSPSAATVRASPGLDERARQIIAAADTFYIASAHPKTQAATGPAQGVDVSHRGGKPGFVKLHEESTLTVPDFVGNYLFNTLGNLALNPRAGLLFLDYASGERLYLAVEARIVWDGPELAAFAGAQRLLRMQVRQMRRVSGPALLRWGQAQLSPFLEATGSWPELPG